MANEYIRRENALYAIQRQRGATRSPAQNRLLDLIRADIARVPAADVAEVVHGRWIPVRESEMTGWDPTVAGCDPIAGYICSVCKEEAVYDCNDNFVLSDYCPICGAKMDGWKENENE